MTKRLGIYKQYSEDDKAAALAFLEAHDGNTFKAANELDIPETTLRAWKNGMGVHPNIALKCEVKKSELSDLFEAAARLYLGRAVEENAIQESTGKEAMTAAAIATDKMRLLRDQATSIQQRQPGLSPNELFERLTSAVRSLEGGTAGTVAPGNPTRPAITSQPARDGNSPPEA